VTLLLKKRLFSSPAAFGKTLAAHIDTLRRAGGQTGYAAGDELPDWLDEALGWDDDLIDDLSGDEAERELPDRAATLVPAPDEDEDELLDRLRGWADRYAEPADSKAKALVTELEQLCQTTAGRAGMRSSARCCAMSCIGRTICASIPTYRSR